ncbi:MAG: hypothetical protein KatS3mg013_1042 [Actinomycetota bacterium]|jgi:hypothetical protein|nr:MAG: hypothetical protein KatS3mg013_1042 [Actinomycetota bacterium]
MVPMGELVRVWATADPVEGELMRARLEAEGVQVLLKGEGGGPYRTGPVYLFVPAEEEVRARAVLDAVASGAFALDLDDEDGRPGAPGADPEEDAYRFEY